MLEDFICSFLLNLAEQGKVKDITISNRILEDLINSDDHFNQISLVYEEQEWMFPLDDYQGCKTVKEKRIEIKEYI